MIDRLHGLFLYNHYMNYILIFVELIALISWKRIFSLNNKLDNGNISGKRYCLSEAVWGNF